IALDCGFLLGWGKISDELKARWRIAVQPVPCGVPFVEEPVLHNSLQKKRLVEGRSAAAQGLGRADQRRLPDLAKDADGFLAAIGQLCSKHVASLHRSRHRGIPSRAKGAEQRGQQSKGDSRAKGTAEQRGQAPFLLHRIEKGARPPFSRLGPTRSLDNLKVRP